MDADNLEIVDVTIRFYRTDGFNYSPVKYKLLDIEFDEAVKTSLMETAIQDYADVDISEHEDYVRIDEVASWSNTQ